MSIANDLRNCYFSYNLGTNYYYILIHNILLNMKKLLSFVALLAMLSLASCGQAVDTETEVLEETNTSVELDAEVSEMVDTLVADEEEMTEEVVETETADVVVESEVVTEEVTTDVVVEEVVDTTVAE